MPKCKRVTRAGAVLEQEVFDIADNLQHIRNACPRPVLRNEEERREYNMKQSKKRFVRLVNANFCPADWYLTLTFDDAHLPDSREDAERQVSNYIRRLQYVNHDMVAVAVVGYGRKTKRLHAHLLVSGIEPEILLKKWTAGKIKRVEPLRRHNVYNGVDYGQDYTGLAAYLFEHTKSKERGKRWKQTKTVRQPKRDKPTRPKRAYSLRRPPRTPKGYRLVESRESGRYYGGYLYFKYVRMDC